jgi:hypothetical protein
MSDDKYIVSRKMVKDLTVTQLQDIVLDVVACIKQDRLRDNSTGWEQGVSRKGYSIPKPGYTEPHSPCWRSLKEAGLTDAEGRLL